MVSMLRFSFFVCVQILRKLYSKDSESRLNRETLSLGSVGNCFQSPKGKREQTSYYVNIFAVTDYSELIWTFPLKYCNLLQHKKKCVENGVKM